MDIMNEIRVILITLPASSYYTRKSKCLPELLNSNIFFIQSRKICHLIKRRFLFNIAGFLNRIINGCATAIPNLI